MIVDKYVNEYGSINKLKYLPGITPVISFHIVSEITKEYNNCFYHNNIIHG